MKVYYLTTNSGLRTLFSVLDAVFRSSPGPQATIRRPRKILLANGAHIGDVVISTAVVGIIKSIYPECEIGFVSGSWSRFLLEGNPSVNHIHTVDHWFFNRANISLLKKMMRHYMTARSALESISSVEYDVAIELHSYFWDMIPLLYRASIPIRIGYSSGGFRGLLTHPVEFQPDKLHESEYQARLLLKIDVALNQLRHPQPFLPRTSGIVQSQESALDTVVGQGEYSVIHAGAGNQSKLWPVDNWRNLAATLSKLGRRIVFTGIGPEETMLAQLISKGIPNCSIACGNLTGKEFVEVIRNAEIVYSLDTSAGHIAGAVSTPCVSICSGVTDLTRWVPRGRNMSPLTRQVPCSPCGLRLGCETMECIRTVRWENVFDAGERLLQDVLKLPNYE